MIPSQNQMQESLIERHGEEVYKKLNSARVAVAGLGGLGSNISVMLTRAGIGELFLVDFDRVDISNLNRQHYFLKHLGEYKTDALKTQLHEINPYVKITTVNGMVTDENVLKLFRDFEIVCEAFDRGESKAMLINALLENRPDIKIVSGSGMGGYESSNLIKTRNALRNLYVCGDMENGLETGKNLMAPRVALCAAHQANMIIRLILGIESV